MLNGNSRDAGRGARGGGGKRFPSAVSQLPKMAVNGFALRRVCQAPSRNGPLARGFPPRQQLRLCRGGAPFPSVFRLRKKAKKKVASDLWHLRFFHFFFFCEFCWPFHLFEQIRLSICDVHLREYSGEAVPVCGARIDVFGRRGGDLVEFGVVFGYSVVVTA